MHGLGGITDGYNAVRNGMCSSMQTERKNKTLAGQLEAPKPRPKNLFDGALKCGNWLAMMVFSLDWIQAPDQCIVIFRLRVRQQGKRPRAGKAFVGTHLYWVRGTNSRQHGVLLVIPREPRRLMAIRLYG